MRKHVLVLMTSASVLVFGAIAASAQLPNAQPPSSPQTPTIVQSPSGGAPNIQPPTAVAPVPKPSSAAGPVPLPPSAHVPLLQPPSGGYARGMMGAGRGQDGWGRGPMGHGTRGSIFTKMIFALMDSDGDGKLSLQEWQAAQERIFKAMDSDKDGFVTLQEMENFMRGGGRRFRPPRE